MVTAKTDSALIEFIKELRAIRDTVSAEELAKAKRYLQLGLPGNFETTAGIAGEFLPLLAYGIPLDFYASAVQQLRRGDAGRRATRGAAVRESGQADGRGRRATERRSSRVFAH